MQNSWGVIAQSPVDLEGGIMKQRQLADLIQMDSPAAVLEEVIYILGLIPPVVDSGPVTSAFNDTVSLYMGTYPCYQSCNTDYHDLRHTTDDLIAMARLIHGAVIDGKNLTRRLINVGLIATLFHDVGYIQEDKDKEGTGGKYTVGHVQRGMDFLESHGAEYGLSDEEIIAGRAMILCTDLNVDMSAVFFPTAEGELLGILLGSADILAQMADRTYLEKLLFLYYEFREGGVGDYKSEVDLLTKTLGFYDFIARRMEKTADMTDRFMRLHLASRWDIKTNLYMDSIERQKNYLKQILKMSDSDPRAYLKREGIVDKVHEMYG
jgi:hypothetical protein